MERPKTTWNHLQPPTTIYNHLKNFNNHLKNFSNHLQPPQKHLQPLANYLKQGINVQNKAKRQYVTYMKYKNRTAYTILRNETKSGEIEQN